jgi:sugar phosphate permease
MFYGWLIVAASALIDVFVGGTTMRGLTALVNPLAATMGWSYAQISLVMTLRGIETGILNPFIGVLVDRWPAKRLVFLGIVIIGLGVLLLSQVNNLTVFYLSFIIIGLGASLGTMMVPMTVIARWFKRNSGKAYGLLAAGTGASGFLVPVVTILIDTYGWRTYLVIVAVTILVIGLPLSFVFHNRPEDYGLLPDGKLENSLDDSHRLQTQDGSVGVREALKTRAFWYISIAFMLLIAGPSAALLHIMPYLTSLGIERSTASMIIMAVYIINIPARLAFGWLSDIFRKKYIISASMFLTSIGLFLFSIIDGSSLGLIIGFVIVYGIGYGQLISLMPPTIREHFGTKNFGTIFGLISILVTIGAVVTPPLTGWVFDIRGVYDPVWLIFSGTCMLGAVLTLSMPQVSKNVKSLLI